ncbi:MAG: IMP dehydrogenase [Patescibacteria group bacterium]|nr:IMP dehydrogenase [Patescibacteria group bacterium]MDE1965791.1 IMP dehydrogenase [Patescibacteria group bacterium]
MLTYDDVRLRSEHSNVLPADTDPKSRLSKNIALNFPVVSAAMDTVTTASTAIAMAEFGGIGILHRGLSVERQAEEAARVKHYLNGLIPDPITVSPDETVAAVLAKREAKGWRFRSFPVVTAKGEFVGLITGHDFDFITDGDIKVKDAMTPLARLVTAKPKTTLEQAAALMKQHRQKVIPLVDGKKLAGVYVRADLERIMSGKGNHNVDRNGRLRVGAAVGVGDGALLRAAELSKVGCDVFHIDTAHGDSKNVFSTIKELKKKYPKIDVIAGNVSSGDGALRLAKAGADGVLVGQGPGSICTTRIVAGIGVPQVSAVYECAKALRGTGVPVIADGGIRNSGDIVIALSVGASAVMLGKLLAGTEEAPGETRLINGVQYKVYRGMGSLEAMLQNPSSLERYRVSAKKFVPEGVVSTVPYQGTLRAVLEQYAGGIRQGMGYIGAATLDELRKKARLFRMTGAGLNESHPHDVLISHLPPNYSGK